MNIALALCIFVLLLFSGVPAAIAMGLPALVYFVVKDIPIIQMVYTMYDQLNSFSLISIPMFIMMGNLVNTIGQTDSVFAFLKRVMKSKRGYSARINVLISLIFAGISGAAVADIGGLGQMEVKAMEEDGYEKGYASALTIATATIGPVFPPSIPLVLFATMAEVSTVRTLIAGVIPGLLLTLVLLLYLPIMDKWQLKSSRAAKTENEETVSLSALFFDAFPMLFAAPAIVTSMMLGVFSPSETGAITVAYFIVVGFMKKKLNLQKLQSCIKSTATMCASILILTAAGGMFSKVLVLERLPQLIVSMLFNLTSNRYMILLLINIVLIILGCFMNSTSILVLSVPIILPITNALGINPIQVGVFMTLNLMLGLITPPFGLSIYTVAKVVDISPERVIKASVPFYIPLLVAVFLITYIPGLSIWLPNMLFGR